jgi:ribonuclease T2
MTVAPLAAMMLAGCSRTPPAGPARKESPAPKPEERPAPRNRVRNASARFDFYVLSLSWSPGFCATPSGKKDDLQCGPQRHYGFVLHGLWPQYEQRGWPQDCSTEPLDPTIVDRMLTIMPSPKLVRHEWTKHGTCSGLTSKEYFDEATQAFEGVTVPARYKAPLKQITVDPREMKRQFSAANPSYPADGFVVLCSGRFLQEVRACVDKDLKGRPCNREVLRSACKAREIIMRPVR